MAPRPRGYTLIELLFATALAAILAGASVPPILASVDRSQGRAGARYLGSRMTMARTYAVTRSATVALRFIWDGSDATFQMFADGNHNGVRTADINAGIDRPLDQPATLSRLFPGVVIGAAGGADPVRLGPTNLLSFTPLGTATAGTIYVRGRDGSQWALRVVGATGRTRLLQLISRRGTWTEAF